MKNTQDIQFVDKVIGALRKTAVELEEFQVKATLGKADAQDKLEALKMMISHVGNSKPDPKKQVIKG